MKRLLILLAIAIAAIGLTSCENQGEARAIIGHSYYFHNETDDELVYFSASGSAQITFSQNNSAPQTINHLNYKIRGCNVEIYMDHSDYWNERAKGELLGAFTYYPEGDYLISSLGSLYVRVN